MNSTQVAKLTGIDEPANGSGGIVESALPALFKAAERKFGITIHFTADQSKQSTLSGPFGCFYVRRDGSGDCVIGNMTSGMASYTCYQDDPRGKDKTMEVMNSQIRGIFWVTEGGISYGSSFSVSTFKHRKI
jgi:hypothetical protein